MAIEISEAFDGGNVPGFTEQASPLLLTLDQPRLTSSAGGLTNRYGNFAAKFTGLDTLTPEFKVTRTGTHLTGSVTDIRPVFSYSEAGPFTEFSTYSKDASFYYFEHSGSFTQDTVYIWAWQPWTTAIVEDWLSTISASEYFHRTTSDTDYTTNSTVGVFADSATATTAWSKSIPSLPMYSFRISDDSVGGKKKCILMGGQHADETVGGRALYHFVEYLLGVSATAANLREKFEFFVYPLVNPCGIYGGHFRCTFYDSSPNADPNLTWDTATPSISTVDQTRDAIIADFPNGDCQCFIDFHGFYTLSEVEIYSKVDSLTKDGDDFAIAYNAYDSNSATTYTDFLDAGSQRDWVQPLTSGFGHLSSVRLSITFESPYATGDAKSAERGQWMAQALNDRLEAGAYDGDNCSGSGCMGRLATADSAFNSFWGKNVKPTERVLLRSDKPKPSWLWLNTEPFIYPRDSIGGDHMTFSGSNAILDVRGFEGNGSTVQSDHIEQTIGTSHPLMWQQDSTIIVLFSADGFGASSFLRLIERASGGSGAGGWSIYRENTDREISWRYNNNASSEMGAGQATAGQYEAADEDDLRLIIRGGPGDWNFHLYLHSTDTWSDDFATTADSMPTTETDVWIGNSSWSDRMWDGVVKAIGFWSKDLGESQSKRIAKDFYNQLFVPASNDFLFIGDAPLPADEVLDASSSEHTHTSQGATLSVKQSLGAANSEHAHTAQGAGIGTLIEVAAAGSEHAHTAQGATIDVLQTVGAADSEHVHTAQGASVTAATDVGAASSEHAHTAQGAALDVSQDLGAANSEHAHTAQGATVTTAVEVGAANAEHAHTSGLASLSVKQGLLAANSEHVHTAQGATITTAAEVGAANSEHTHTSQTASLAIKQELLAANSEHAHTSQGAAIITDADVLAANSEHAHTSQVASLTDIRIQLGAAGSEHVHTSEGAGVVTTVDLGAANAEHLHTAQSAPIIVSNVLAAAAAQHSHTAQGAAITGIKTTLGAASSEHIHNADFVAFWSSIPAFRPAYSRVLNMQRATRTFTVNK